MARLHSAGRDLSCHTVTLYKMWGRSEARERDHTILANALSPHTCTEISRHLRLVPAMPMKLNETPLMTKQWFVSSSRSLPTGQTGVLSVPYTVTSAAAETAGPHAWSKGPTQAPSESLLVCPKAFFLHIPVVKSSPKVINTCKGKSSNDGIASRSIKPPDSPCSGAILTGPHQD